MKLDGYYFSKSRHAILSIMRSIGVTRLLLPMYYCHDVTDFLEENGIEIKLYEVDFDYKIILDSIFLNEFEKQYKVIVLPTYFGDPTNLKFINLFVNNIVIVDNVHSLNSKWNDSSVMFAGDFSISSIWKYTGNLNDGAIMLINNSDYSSYFELHTKYEIEISYETNQESFFKFNYLKNNFFYKSLRLIKEILFVNKNKIINNEFILHQNITINRFKKVMLGSLSNDFYRNISSSYSLSKYSENPSFLIPITQNKYSIIFRYLFSFENKFQICKWPMLDNRIVVNSQLNKLWKNTLFIRIFT
jgi:hypothetical protein